jgi:O-antigen ligase
MLKYFKSYNLLILSVCAIPMALVVGAAVLEIFIFLSCLVFFYLNFKKKGLDYYKNFFFITFFSFCIFLIFGSLSSEYISNSIRNSIFYFRFGILTLAIWYLLDCYKKFIYFFFVATTVTLICVVLYSFLQLFILHNYVDASRISGLFGSESVQGSFLLRITPIYIITYLYNKKYLTKIFRYIFYSILFLNFILIILSGERAAIFLMFIAIIFSFIFLKICLKKIFYYSLFFFTIFSLTIIIYPKAKERIFVTTYEQFIVKNNEKKNIYFFSEGHQNHFNSAIIMFKQYFFKGVGVRNFRIECKKDLYKNVGPYHCSTHPHNTYLQILSETGIIGISFFMLFMFFIFKEVYKFLKDIYIKDKKINKPLAFCFIIIFTNFFPFVTTGSFFNNWLSVFYFLPISFLLHQLNYNKNR